MKFIRKPGFHLKTKPQVVGEVCMGLEKDGKLTPKNLVDASRDKSAPLHNEFEWRDGVAAEKYREVQAGYIIRSVAVRITEIPTETTQMSLQITESKEPNVRYFHATAESGYDSLETISKDTAKRDELMRMCLKDIRNFKEKYYILRAELPMLFRIIDDLTDEKETAV